MTCSVRLMGGVASLQHDVKSSRQIRRPNSYGGFMEATFVVNNYTNKYHNKGTFEITFPFNFTYRIDFEDLFLRITLLGLGNYFINENL